MKTIVRFACTLFATISLLVLLPLLSIAQGKCDQKGKIERDADVYKQVPRYVTGSGWIGERVTRLNKNTQVYICGEQNASFGLSTKTWVQIAYRSVDKWVYGWVLKEAVSYVTGSLRKWEPRSGFSMAAVAFAADKPANDPGKTEWTLGPPPPLPAPPSEDQSASAGKEPGQASLSDLGQLYWPLFVAMALGMAAKTIVDWLDSSDKALVRQHVRNAVVSILVSPIVFLGFLTAGQFSTSTQTFVVLCLLAFQNGFFWQTVLKRKI